jgi:hypothetical protein
MRYANAPEILETRSFFGCLEHVLSFELPALPALHLQSPEPFVLVAVRTCNTNTITPVLGFDLHCYSKMGGLGLVDLTTVQCGIGRVRAGNTWTIIDRTGSLQRAWYSEEEDV